MPRFLKNVRARLALTVFVLLVGGFAALAPVSQGG